MNAITLHQPWASLIASGYKTTETRSWPPPTSLVGTRIAIHAAKRRPRPSEWNDDVTVAVAGEELPLGAIVATAQIDGCAMVLSDGFTSLPKRLGVGEVWVIDRNSLDPRDAYLMDSDPYGDYSDGRWIWLLSGVTSLTLRIEVKGRQGVWTLPPSVQVRLEALPHPGEI